MCIAYCMCRSVPNAHLDTSAPATMAMTPATSETTMEKAMKSRARRLQICGKHSALFSTCPQGPLLVGKGRAMPPR